MPKTLTGGLKTHTTKHFLSGNCHFC